PGLGFTCSDSTEVTTSSVRRARRDREAADERRQGIAPDPLLLPPGGERAELHRGQALAERVELARRVGHRSPAERSGGFEPGNPPTQALECVARRGEEPCSERRIGQRPPLHADSEESGVVDDQTPK